MNIFPELKDHMLETAVMDNHVFKLIKNVTRIYCKVRMHHLAKTYSTKETGEQIREKLTKVIHFKNQ